jgi:hypothetical protein
MSALKNVDMDARLDEALNTVIAALRGTEAARLLTDDVGGGIERLREHLCSAQRKASEVPGMSATLDKARSDLARAIQLLHMLDDQDARHPDVAAFLDEYESRAQEPRR